MPPRPARSGWFARWFGPHRCQPAPFDPEPFPNIGDGRFTPESCPGLSAEACAFFNTPVEECDPDLLRVMLFALAAHIADSLPPELGMGIEALFSTLCDRLSTEPHEAAPDAPPAAAPATPESAMPETQPADEAAAQATPENVAPAEQPAAGPPIPDNTVPDAPPAPPIQAQGTQPADDAAAASTTVWETTPEAAALTGPAFRRRARSGSSRWFRHRRRSLVRSGRSGFRRGLPGESRRPPLRRLCYAACAGPP